MIDLAWISHKSSTALRNVGPGAGIVRCATLQGADPASPAHPLETRTSTRPRFARYEFCEISRLVIVCAYSLIVFFAAIRGKTSKDATAEEYFLNSRKLGWPSIAFSTIAVELGEQGASRVSEVTYPKLIEQSGHHGATFYEHQAFMRVFLLLLKERRVARKHSLRKMATITNEQNL